MEYGGIYIYKRENAGTCWKNCETYGKIIEQSWNRTNITLYQQKGSTFSMFIYFTSKSDWKASDHSSKTGET